MSEKVTFASGDDTLVGELHLAAGAERGPVVVVAGSWTTVKEQMARRYAAGLATRGISALAFDFRGFGESGGRPLEVESPLRKAADLRAAVDFLATHPAVDPTRIGALGICAGGGYTAVNAATKEVLWQRQIVNSFVLSGWKEHGFRSAATAMGRSGRSPGPARCPSGRSSSAHRHRCGERTDQCRVVLAGPEARMIQDVVQELCRGDHTATVDPGLRQGPSHPRDGPGAVRRPHHDLRQQRIVVRGNRIAGLDVRVDAYERPAGQYAFGESAWCRGEFAARVLGVDPAFDRHPVRAGGSRRYRQPLARRDAQLFGHQVQAGDHLGDRMFHLQTAIHLHEVEPAVRGEQEFEGARTDIADRRGPAHRRRADPLGQFGGQARRGRLFHELLVPALQRAVPQAQMHHAAVGIGQDLRLDVPRRVQIAFHVEAAVTDDGRGAGSGLLPGRGEFGGVAHDPHAPAAAARDRLDDHRVADLAGQRPRPILRAP